ncbi:MAG: glycosyltransferase family 1 protein, partial [Acidobacteriota bacterium]|nr:glycosyltransferase family 1 protein [Acidobacteriota bacterium]
LKKIKILEMIDKPFLGGGQINLLSLAKSLDKRKFDVSVCSQSGGPFVDKVKENNIKHFPV